VAPEAKGSSPYSQEPATGPYPEPTGANLPKIHFVPIYAVVFQVVSFLLAFPSKKKFCKNNQEFTVVRD
jgi:hypothetical protein